MANMEIVDLIRVVKAIKDPIAVPMVRTLLERLQNLVDIGLEYLSLDRETDTLSGGESQRVKIVKHLGSSLVDVMYVFDEPSVGMHPPGGPGPSDPRRTRATPGTPLLVVKPPPEVTGGLAHIVDMGPHAGS